MIPVSMLYGKGEGNRSVSYPKTSRIRITDLNFNASVKPADDPSCGDCTFVYAVI